MLPIENADTTPKSGGGDTPDSLKHLKRVKKDTRIKRMSTGVMGLALGPITEGSTSLEVRIRIPREGKRRFRTEDWPLDDIELSTWPKKWRRRSREAAERA